MHIFVPMPPSDAHACMHAAAGDRHMSSWITIIGKRGPQVPVLNVELRRSGEELMGVTIKVRSQGTSCDGGSRGRMRGRQRCSHGCKGLKDDAVS